MKNSDLIFLEQPYSDYLYKIPCSPEHQTLIDSVLASNIENVVLLHNAKMESTTPKDSKCQRMLQLLAVVAMIILQVPGFLLLAPLTLYLILYTKYWWFCLMYVAWYSTVDKKSCVTGERRSEWVRSWSWWDYATDYYPLKVVKLPWGKLDPRRNYLFCYFPHGMLSASSFLTIATNATEFGKYFPRHERYLHTLNLFFKVPFLRELGLCVGGLDASKEALVNILSKEGGGYISTLVVGGAQEAYFCKPGVHKIIYKKRKGFIKIAMMQGAPLVPVYCFGENELYTQVEVATDSYFHKFREIVRTKLGFSLIFPIGRKGLLAIIPRRKPLTIVVGEPIDVQKTENPTQEQIDNLHKLFEKKLVELFESQKRFYLKDHESAHLEIC